MRLFAILALFFGLVLAGTAVYFVSERFRSQEELLARQRAKPQVELVEVAVAAKPLKYGDAITRDNVTLVPWPKQHQPAGAFNTAEALIAAEGTKPRYALVNMIPGEAVLGSRVTAFGELAGMAQRLQPGMRAFTIKVDVATGVSGFLAVGDFVDVLWTGVDKGQQLAKLILERVPVIAIDQQSQEDRTRAVVARTVTLEVSTEQVTLLTLAQNSGRLALSLRGLEDTSLAGEIVVDRTAIVGVDVVEPVIEPEAIPTVRERRGTEVKDVPTQ
jgi:pilus assembly protein CpaB